MGDFDLLANKNQMSSKKITLVQVHSSQLIQVFSLGGDETAVKWTELQSARPNVLTVSLRVPLHLLPSRERVHIPPWEKENHRLQKCLGRGICELLVPRRVSMNYYVHSPSQSITNPNDLRVRSREDEWIWYCRLFGLLLLTVTFGKQTLKSKN